MATSIGSHNPRLVLLFAAALLVFSATDPSAAQPVIDNDGDEVRTDSQYIIALEGFSFFGGLTRLSLPNETACLRHVGLGESDPVLPVSFTPGIPEQAPDGVLRLSVRSKVAFQVLSSNPCLDPGVWTTTRANSSDAVSFTAIVAGHDPASQVTDVWFEVRETEQERVYKLVSCPCLPCRIFCLEEVGLYAVGLEAVLGIGGWPFPFRFLKYQPSQ